MRIVNAKSILVLLVGVMAVGCGTTVAVKQWDSQRVLHGQGGAFTTVKGVEVWDYGAPDRDYRIIAVLEGGSSTPGVRLARVLAASKIDNAMVDKAREVGADGIIVMGRGGDAGEQRVVAAIKYVTAETATH